MNYEKIIPSDYTENELRDIWQKEYCDQVLVTFDGIKVKFFAEMFDHAFYESSRRNSRVKTKAGGHKDCLSEARLEKMLWIKDALADPEAELYVGYDKERRSYDNSRRVAVVKGDYTVIIRLKDDQNAKFVTAYVADNSIEKIRTSPQWTKKKDAD